MATVYVAIALYTEVPDGMTCLGESASFMASLLVFICPVYAGLMLAQAFEDRLVQASIMSGKSRFSIVLVKTIFFSLLMFMLMVLTTFLSTLVVSLIKGWGNADLQGLTLGQYIAGVIMFLGLMVVGYSLVVPAVFSKKKVGSSIGLGLIVSMVVYMATEQLAKNPDLHGILQITPIGRSFFVFNNMTTGFWLGSLLVIFGWPILYVVLGYLLIKQEEFK